tara:strand:- start:98 stop:952 length:855 start_codon:yes stop_codon:yes gene_type:complete
MPNHYNRNRGRNRDRGGGNGRMSEMNNNTNNMMSLDDSDVRDSVNRRSTRHGAGDRNIVPNAPTRANQNMNTLLGGNTISPREQARLNNLVQTTSQPTPYVLADTGEAYRGIVFQHSNGEFYTSVDGSLTGNAKKLVPASESTIKPLQPINTGDQDNPVVRLYMAPTSPRYYRPDGTIVAVGARLHQHQDGTIMTEHTMGANDNSVVVTTVPPNGRTTRTNGMTQSSRAIRTTTMGRRTRARRAQTQNMNRGTTTPTRTTRTQTTTRRTMTTRRNGGGSSGGGY